MKEILQNLYKIARLLKGGIEEHPFFRRVKEKIESPDSLQLTEITKKNLADLPYFDDIRITGVNTHETTNIIALGLRIGDQHFEGNLLYYHTAILPLKLNPLKFKFLLNVLSNGQNHLKNERIHAVIEAGLAKFEFYPK